MYINVIPESWELPWILTSGQVVQGVPKTPQTIENDLLFEFEWPSTKLNPRVHERLT